MLPVDLAKIAHEESILISWVASLMVDILHTGTQSIANQLLGRRDAMVLIIEDRILPYKDIITLIEIH